MSVSRGLAIITVEYEMEVPLEHLFVDGNMPEKPTKADVEKLIERDGSLPYILTDWGFDDPYVSITVQLKEDS